VGRLTTPVYEDPAIRRVLGEAIRPGGLVVTDHAIELAALPPGAVVLDVGCGAGVTVEHLVDRHGLDAVGVDPSAALIAAGRARRPGLPLLRARAERLPLADGSVDAALAECILSVTSDAGTALAELARVLRPQGRLIVSDLYARRAGGVPELRRLPARSCLHGALSRQELLDLVRAKGFRLRCWEDHSDALARLAVHLLWEEGSTCRLWCPDVDGVDPAELRTAIRRARPGYYLLIAENSRG
jgi:SAM-dependent methyltransferase